MISTVELPESFKMNALQIPRRGMAAGRVGLALAPSRPASGSPELTLPSISFAGGPGGSLHTCKLRCPPAPSVGCEPAVRDFSGSFVSLLYLNVALASGLGLLFLPSAGEALALMICPIWSVAVLVHAFSGDTALLSAGIALAMTYPVLVLAHDFQLYAVYLLIFAGFVSRGFWRDQRGVWLVLCVACWLGVLAGVAGLLVFPNRPGVLEAASLSGLALAVVCTRRLARFRYKIVSTGASVP